jgi:Arc/MetJ family transcription regulator
MLKRTEVWIDDDLVREVIHRYGLADAREAVHMALKALIDDGDGTGHRPEDDEWDEFSDPSAWQLRRTSEPG